MIWVRWHDAASDSGWCAIKDAQLPGVVESVGYLVRDDEETMTIALSCDGEVCLCPLTIPRGMILETGKLERVTKGGRGKATAKAGKESGG